MHTFYISLVDCIETLIKAMIDAMIEALIGAMYVHLPSGGKKAHLSGGHTIVTESYIFDYI